MWDYIPLSMLNDFIFCPYSIYLHNIYMDTDEETYHAAPQTKGKIAHEATDNKKSTRKTDIMALPVFCNEIGIMGKIDLYKSEEKHLIERKYKLAKIYQGQLYQLWGEYFCMKEMGYEIDKLSFYEISTNRMIPMEIPGEEQKEELKNFVRAFKSFNPVESIEVNDNKCAHCIYNPLCDKTNVDYVYQ